MAVVDKRPHGVGIAKIHTKAYARIGKRAVREVGHTDRVTKEWFAYGHTQVVDQHEMKLMDVESVQLGGPVLDDPVFHSAALHDDVRYPGGGVELRRLLPING